MYLTLYKQILFTFQDLTLFRKYTVTPREINSTSTLRLLCEDFILRVVVFGNIVLSLQEGSLCM
jgi:hypothetical protein